MRVGLFSPLLINHEGGGERYLLTIAEHLSQNRDCKVELVVQKHFDEGEGQNLLKKRAEQFDLNLDKAQVSFGPFGQKGSALDRYLFTRKFDAFLAFTDGSVFFAGSKRNILHIQIPLKKGPTGFINRLKLGSWNVKVANANFTKRQVEKNWHIKIDYVHWGAVNGRDFIPGKKENIILHVGRFFTGLHCKRQDVIVDTFKKMADEGLGDWKLVLVGSVDPGEDNAKYANKVKQSARGYPIIVEHNLPFKQLQDWYAKSKIYWHATGFDLDENEFPEKMEHLGLTTVEAMCAGCVPVVINKGGQPEIVTDGKNGLLWNTQGELIEKTLNVIKNDLLRSKLSSSAKKRAEDFSKENFQEMTDTIFGLRKKSN